MGYIPNQIIAHFNQIDLTSVQNQGVQIAIDTDSSFVVREVIVIPVSGTITNAAGGIFTGPNKTGTPIVSANQAFNALPNNKTAILNITGAATNTIFSQENVPELYLTLTTGSSTPAIADIYIIADIITPD